MKSSAHKIATWLRQVLAASKNAGPLVRLELAHLPVSKKKADASPVHTIDAAGAEDEAGFVARASTELAEMAENDADGIARGPQRYIVFAFREADPKKPQSRTSFFVAAKSDPDEEPLESEPPNRVGVTSMLMRHLEIQQRSSMEAVSKMMTALGSMVESLANDNEKLRARHIQSIETLEGLLSMHNDRELERRKAEARISLMSDAAKDLKLLVPAIVGRLGGAKPPASPEHEDVRIVAVRRFMESLSDEQREKLAAGLTPQQQIALMEAMQGLSN